MPRLECRDEFAPGFWIRSELPHRNTERKSGKRERRNAAGPSPARAELPAKSARGGGVRAPGPRGVVAPKTEHQNQWGKNQRPAQLQRGRVIECRVKSDPYLGGENFDLQNGGAPKIF